jgi:hypothetical protein
VSFPQRLQAADALPGGDQLDVRDVPNDLKHWIRKPAATASGRTGKVITRRSQTNFDVLRPPRSTGQGLGDVVGLQVRVPAENLVTRAASGNETDHGANGDTHAPNARLSTHYGGVTGDARQ